MEGQRALWDERLLARKTKKKKDKNKAKDNHKEDKSDAKKMKKDEKKKVQKLKKEAVQEDWEWDEPNNEWNGWNDENSDNDCICADEQEDWTGDSWIGDHGLPIGWSEDGWDVHEEYKDDLKHLRADIVQLIDYTDRDLLPQCLRLSFHDCIDGCDGCIDMTEFDNRGLEDPINLLFPLVQKYKHTFTRADVWAYCAVVAADMAVVDNRPEELHFYMHYVGRKDCEGADEKGFGGPPVVMYEPHLTTHEMIEFFYKRFGFDRYETAVIMGGHSAAVAHRENLGFGNKGRKDGWVHDADLYKLSNLYYTSMLDNNHVWELIKVQNEDEVPTRYQWYFGEEDSGPIMLTDDMSLIFDFKGFIAIDSQGVGGKVMCRAHINAEFEVGEEDDPRDVPLCPMAEETREIVEELARDNTQFLFAFARVLNKMVTNGYGKHQLGSKWDRNLISSKERGEHSTYSRDDGGPEMEESTKKHQLAEKSARKKELNSAKITQKYSQSTGKSAKSKTSKSSKKWCSCHKHKQV